MTRPIYLIFKTYNFKDKGNGGGGSPTREDMRRATSLACTSTTIHNAITIQFNIHASVR